MAAGSGAACLCTAVGATAFGTHSQRPCHLDRHPIKEDSQSRMVTHAHHTPALSFTSRDPPQCPHSCMHAATTLIAGTMPIKLPALPCPSQPPRPHTPPHFTQAPVHHRRGWRYSVRQDHRVRPHHAAPARPECGHPQPGAWEVWGKCGGRVGRYCVQPDHRVRPHHAAPAAGPERGHPQPGEKCGGNVGEA